MPGDKRGLNNESDSALCLLLGSSEYDNNVGENRALW